MIGGFFGDGPNNDDKEKKKEPQQKAMTAGGFGTGGEAPFELRGFNLGDALVAVGLGITLVSFIDYLNNSGGFLGTLGFVYGLPLALGGSALKYATIEPVELKSTPRTEALFEKYGTETLQ